MTHCAPSTISSAADAPPPADIAAVLQAAAHLRAGLPVFIGDAQAGDLFVLAVETADSAQLQSLRAAGPALLILTHARARTLKIPFYTPQVVAVPLADDATPARLRAIADPTADLAQPLKGPFAARRTPLADGYGAGVKLAKLAGLLPAVIAVPVGTVPAGGLRIAADAIGGYDAAVVETLRIVTRARVPLEGAEQAELVAFRPRDGGAEHFAIVIGAPPTDAPVLTRLHSQCFTGDLLGSLKCDCGVQLRGAIARIAQAGGGVLLYLAQEGRGIGRSTSCAPTGCRIRASTRSTPMKGWASNPTNADTASLRGCCIFWATKRCACLPTTRTRWRRWPLPASMCVSACPTPFPPMRTIVPISPPRPPKPAICSKRSSRPSS
jgi:GTP cyclohydrolase II